MLLLYTGMANAQQDTVRYVGETLSNVDYHHGQLTPAVGVHNIQVFRANREHPEWAGGLNWTYNHQPMLVYWNNRFYLHFLSDPVGEHVPPGKTVLITSEDGYRWSAPVTLFPEYKLPDGFQKEGRTEVAHNSFAVMHQRIGFYVSKEKRLFALGFYGIALGPKDDPNDGRGVGRVIREIKRDGSFGPVYFLRYNHRFSEKNTHYPFYKSAKDKGLVAACEEILATPLLMQQMVEEADRNDPLIPLKKDYKAFNYYHLPDGRVAGLWKYALTSISSNEGKSWEYTPTRAPGFVNANAKIWGQRTSDGKYITVYNPSEFRWPLALSVSDDGLHYKNLLLVNGEITSLRYGGAYKSYGPQYVRGIQEMDGKTPDGNVWVGYSMNKEDIWVAKIPVPVKSGVTGNVADDFEAVKPDEALKNWNLYSPLWAPVGIERSGGKNVLSLADYDPFDFAKAERVVPEAAKMKIAFSITPQQTANGRLDIELQDAKNTACVRISFDSTGAILTKAGYRDRALAKYEAGKTYNFVIELDAGKRFYTVTINDAKPVNGIFFAPVHKVHHVTFRTGSVRRFPDADTPTDQDYDLPRAGEKDQKAIYQIGYFKAVHQ
ncbi:exo-alpha-sialidase [Niabella ginsenosidivorans]|uniref:exo-alpha-sialidase n=1 Tax=Niabella ginsenosidivorans TaxID=1176587 RepID=UPI001FE1C690|nr:exo-alpha-sialidase [Niabella ginsenosidivorans]